MDKKMQKQLKKSLEKEKMKLTKDLKSFANKDTEVKGNWLTRFPFFGISRSYDDENAERIEEYENLLSVEHTLELRLKDINNALEKIKNNNYGICEKCKKEIEIKRLKIVPEAKQCLICSKENS
ncbi:MAG: TraR/DksA C4-type zinc finger protein [Patescibacteria group bacterium]